MIARFVLLFVVLFQSIWGAESAHSIAASSKALAELEKLEGAKKGCDNNASADTQITSSKDLAPNQAGLHYNSAFFDIYPSHLAPTFGYITYSTKDSFDANAFLRRVRNIHERNIKAYIKGRIEVPKEIATAKVRLYSGEDYRYKGWDGERFIIYNDKIKTQYLRTPLVDVEEDVKGRRYISFVITLFIYTPYKLEDSSEMLPDAYLFQIAPNEEDFAKKFRKANVFIVEE